LVPWLQTKAVGNREPAQVIASDGIELNGFRLRCCVGGDPRNPLGYVLFVQGNAMLALTIVSDLKPLSEAGFDVFIFDFRGYGFSGGQAKSAAIISDYREIVANLNSRGYPGRLIYGISFGGAVILNAVGTEGNYDALIIDATPAKLPFFCPGTLNPERHLPQSCARLLLIAGDEDRVVPARQMRTMIETARDRGASVYQSKTLCHPFMGCGDAERFAKAIEFFKRSTTNQR
jgi:alpha/beta superfamily hydrolase